MAGRQWHWIAGGMASVAVFVAVLLHDTTSRSIVRAHPFAANDYTPEVGKPILAVPTIDATTVTSATPPTPPAPPQNPVKQTPPAAPPPSSTTQPRPPAKPPKVTLTLSIPGAPDAPAPPVFFPDCETAWFFGAAPINEGEPGYRQELDRDRDGVACEPR